MTDKGLLLADTPHFWSPSTNSERMFDTMITGWAKPPLTCLCRFAKSVHVEEIWIIGAMLSGKSSSMIAYSASTRVLRLMEAQSFRCHVKRRISADLTHGCGFLFLRTADALRGAMKN